MSGSEATPGWTLGELAERLDGTVEGDASLRVTGVRTLDDAGAEDLSFLHDGSYRAAAAESSAAALLVPRDLLSEDPASDAAELGRPLVVVKSSRFAVARILELLHPEHRPEPGIHPTAVIGDGCEIHSTVHVGPYAVVGAGSVIEAHGVIEAHAVVGRDCRLGEGSRLRPGVVLYDGCRLGKRVQVHSGSVIGADGFGYATFEGVHHKIPQVGIVELGDDVEVGANSAVDRAALEATRIGDGTKIDNLVQVGHNVQTGKGCLLCGQAGIGGSTVLGDYVVLGGQGGVVDHVSIGSGTQMAAKSAAYGSLEGGLQVGGIPAVDLRAFHRQSAALARLPDLLKRVRQLEKQLVEKQRVEKQRVEEPPSPETR